MLLTAAAGAVWAGPNGSSGEDPATPNRPGEATGNRDGEDEGAAIPASGPATVKVKLTGADETVDVVRGEDGGYRFVLHTADGPRDLSPDAFAERVYTEQAHRSWVLVLLNATSAAGFFWVGLGLLGQLAFSGRMLVQWLTSERHRRSVVPTVFWWMSLLGATMLLVYFIWRKDIVGVIGQSTGWLIYGRNLLLIYRVRQHEPQPA